MDQRKEFMKLLIEIIFKSFNKLSNVLDFKNHKSFIFNFLSI